MYDKTKAVVSSTFGESCTNTWATVDGDITTPASPGGWHSCGDVNSYEVWMEAITSFGKDTPEWYVPKAEIRQQLWIEKLETYYVTYIDFDELELVAELWQNN